MFGLSRQAGKEDVRSPMTIFLRICALHIALWMVIVAAPSRADEVTDRDLLHFAAESLDIDRHSISISAGDGPARIVMRGGKALAYIASTWDVAHSAGYSGRPVDILVLIDGNAVIRGAKLISQQEPVLTLGIAHETIEKFVEGFAGYDLREPLAKAGEQRAGQPDAIAGATISSGVIRNGVIRTARTIATTYGLLGHGSTGTGPAGLAPGSDWPALLAAGAIARLTVTGAEADRSLGTASGAEPAASFIDLFAAPLDDPAVGASLLGEAGYSSLMGGIAATDHPLLVAANGLYSFKGTDWRRSGAFERIEIEQGEHTIGLTKTMYRPLESLDVKGVPDLRELAIFVIPSASGFDPGQPFRLSLIATRQDAGGTDRQARFVLSYAGPKRLDSAAESPEPELWQANWERRIPAIAVVAAMLLGLYLILIFQNQIASRPRLYTALRLGYLTATTVILGAILQAQLSVVHVVTFLQALRTQFSWETFLLDPVIFIIWGWVAVAMLFWGRVYCGWLCPFGAVQELLNKLARRLGVKQIEIPFALHERLWPLKYIGFLGIFAVSFLSIAQAFRCAEIEPFKTVVTLRFMRPAPYVLYAVALLAAGLFVERFFCRYLCPLGAAIAIPARLRMFEWLKRRPQCGRECRICATKCPVQAIHPEGMINPNECVYCFNCQTLYFNEHICPPLKARAARRAAYAGKPQAEEVAP